MRTYFDKEELFGWNHETELEQCGLSQKATEELGFLTIQEVEGLSNEEIQNMLVHKVSKSSFYELRKAINKHKKNQEKQKQIGFTQKRMLELTSSMIEILCHNIFENRQEYELVLSKIGLKKEHVNYFIYTEFFGADEDDFELYINSMHPLEFRTKTMLSNAGLKTLKDINKLSDEEIRKIKGIGQKSMEEIISFRNEINKWLSQNRYEKPSDKDLLKHFKNTTELFKSFVHTKREKHGLLRLCGFNQNEVYRVL